MVLKQIYKKVLKENGISNLLSWCFVHLIEVWEGSEWGKKALNLLLQVPQALTCIHLHLFSDWSNFTPSLQTVSLIRIPKSVLRMENLVVVVLPPPPLDHLQALASSSHIELS